MQGCNLSYAKGKQAWLTSYVRHLPRSKWKKRLHYHPSSALFPQYQEPRKAAAKAKRLGKTQKDEARGEIFCKDEMLRVCPVAKHAACPCKLNKSIKTRESLLLNRKCTGLRDPTLTSAEKLALEPKAIFSSKPF